MTENEAKEYMENEVECIERASYCDRDCLNCELVKEEEPLIESYNIAIQALEEIQKYRAIGTVDEFKALKEKNVAKKPRFYAHNYYCTECGNLVGNNEFEWQRFLYCDNCGQKLDWQ